MSDLLNLLDPLDPLEPFANDTKTKPIESAQISI